MFDFDAPKEKRSTDWSGTIIGISLLPVFLVFVFLGKAEMGFTACIVLGASMGAVRFRWQLRRHVWFWATIILILALHIPLLFLVRWPDSNVPTLVYSLPLGLVDALLIMGALSLAEKIFSENSSSTGEDT